jgi:hypothetical protein
MRDDERLRTHAPIDVSFSVQLVELDDSVDGCSHSGKGEGGQSNSMAFVTRAQCAFWLK